MILPSCILGDLSHVPDQSTIEDFGEVNVALVPVGGGNTLTAGMASDVIALIEPNYIVPMHYAIDGLNLDLEPVDKFLKGDGGQPSEAKKNFYGLHLHHFLNNPKSSF